MSYRTGLLIGALLVTIPTAALGQVDPGRTPTPISRQDLTRMLSSGTYAYDEIAGMIRRACLSFIPTATERELYRGLGAERSVLSAIDACLSPPASLRASASELPAQLPAGPPATFAAVRPESLTILSADRPSAERPPASQEGANGPPLAGPPVAGPVAEERASRPAAPRERPELNAQPESSVSLRELAEGDDPPLEAGGEAEPRPEGNADAGPDTASASTQPDPQVRMSMVEPDPAPPTDEVSRLRALAAGAAERGDAESLLRIHRTIVLLAPEDPLAWFQLGSVLASVGQGEEARDAFIRAATLDRVKRRARP